MIGSGIGVWAEHAACAHFPCSADQVKIATHAGVNQQPTTTLRSAHSSWRMAVNTMRGGVRFCGTQQSSPKSRRCSPRSLTYL